MTQIEFVTELEQALRGNVEERIIQENVRYYNDYISEQRAAGKSEEEIFASLGSPRLIAKTIIDTSGEASTQGNSRAGNHQVVPCAAGVPRGLQYHPRAEPFYQDCGGPFRSPRNFFAFSPLRNRLLRSFGRLPHPEGRK